VKGASAAIGCPNGSGGIAADPKAITRTLRPPAAALFLPLGCDTALHAIGIVSHCAALIDEARIGVFLHHGEP
jgi:hypothetical protein